MQTELLCLAAGADDLISPDLACKHALHLGNELAASDGADADACKAMASSMARTGSRQGLTLPALQAKQGHAAKLLQADNPPCAHTDPALSMRLWSQLKAAVLKIQGCCSGCEDFRIQSSIQDASGCE